MQFLSLVVKGPRVMFKMFNSGCGMGPRAGAWPGPDHCPWVLDVRGRKDTQANGSGVGTHDGRCLPIGIEIFRTFLTGMARRLSQGTPVACQLGRGQSSRLLSALHIDLGLGGAHCLM